MAKQKNIKLEDNLQWLYAVLLIIVFFLLYQLLMNNPLTIPEAGYCIEKNLDTSYTTIKSINGTKESIEYCQLETFCEAYAESVVNEDEDFDQEYLNSFAEEQETNGYECFQDTAPHSQRANNLLFNKPTKIQVAKFVCCTDNNLQDDSCSGNTCNGRYTGFLDTGDCRIYAIEQGFNEEGIMKITTCGGNPDDIDWHDDLLVVN